MPPLPLTVGAALISSRVSDYRDWLLAEQRDLEIQDPISVEIFDNDWQGLARQTRAALAGHSGRVGIHGPFFSLNLGASDLEIRAVVVRRLRQGLDFCAELGATHMVVHSPFYQALGYPYVPHSPDAGHRFVIEQAQAALEQLIPLAEQIGCTIVIENIYDLSPAPILALVKTLNVPQVRMSLDAGHAYIQHYLHAAPPPDYWVREAGALLAHVHIQDTDGYGDRHWVPGEGSVKWHAVFRELAALEQRPRLILELVDQERIPAAAAWLAAQELGK